ncbi:hypothetical protein [Kitasatospora sp. NPDC004531]
MINWTGLADWCSDTDRVPALLDHLEREDDTEAWKELGLRLILEHDLLVPAAFLALPRLVRLAPDSAPARALAGEILERAAGHHGCDELLAGCAGAVAEFRGLLDGHLRTRPADYLAAFRAFLATEGEFHWAAELGDFTDDFYPVHCPHCAAKVTIAIGDHGRYSAIRDWTLGDVNRRSLRPASPSALSGTGRRMHQTATRDGQDQLSHGITHLYGEAECPSCACVFNPAAEYTAANRPPLRGTVW